MYNEEEQLLLLDQKFSAFKQFEDNCILKLKPQSRIVWYIELFSNTNGALICMVYPY